MSSVLPLDTQRYQSGDCTLEITSHPSPLSQWSDRAVVRQLRFSLWLEQPERQRLAMGNHHQLVVVGEVIEAYVQLHLSQQAWPQLHGLTLLNQPIELTTLQLFDLAEVFSTYGQQHIILPMAQRPRRSRRLWAGSAVASLFIAVGVAAIYRVPTSTTRMAPLETSQLPEASFEEPMHGQTVPELDVAAPPALEQAPIIHPSNKTRLNPPGDDTLAGDIADPVPRLDPSQNFTAPRPSAGARATPPVADTPAIPRPLEILPDNLSEPEPGGMDPSIGIAQAEMPSVLENESIGPLSDDINRSDELSGLSVDPRPQNIPTINDAASPTAVPPVASSAPVTAESSPASRSSSAAAPSERLSAERLDGDELAAIAAYFARYQPLGVEYPLAYTLQIGPDGTILFLEPVQAPAPSLTIPDHAMAPSLGRTLDLELIYTGAEQPTVREH